jgi:ribosome recycling factor
VTDESLVAVALEESREKMQRAVEHTKSEFSTIRTGRASPAPFERLRVDYFGTEVSLQSLAGFSISDARTLVINPYDKGSLKAIEKAIQSSDLGMNPSNDGQVIRISFPPLTEERRRDFVKAARQRAEDGRVAVRAVRRATRHEVETWEHDAEISSDDLDWAEKELETITHEFVAEIDRLLTHKEQELLEV